MPRSRQRNPQRQPARYSVGMNTRTALATNAVTRPRSVERLVQGQATSDGAGVKLRISAHRGRHFRLIVDGISA